MPSNETSPRAPTLASSNGAIGRPGPLAVCRLIAQVIGSFVRERPAQIILSAFLLLMLWGTHGRLDLLSVVWPSYVGPGQGGDARPSLLPGVPWDDELISFWGGAFLVVVVPIAIIKLGFKQRLAEYGLGLPPKGRRALAVWSFVTLVVVLAPLFCVGQRDASMRAVYPFFRHFDSTLDFALYELCYLPFFIAIEFVFRGYLLFGLAGVRDSEVEGAGHGVAGPLYFQRYGMLIQMLSYTAWHLGKPLPELWGTPVWGLAAGAIAYGTRSIWPVVAAHWILNVVIDYAILHNW